MRVDGWMCEEWRFSGGGGREGVCLYVWRESGTERIGNDRKKLLERRMDGWMDKREEETTGGLRRVAA